MQAALEAVTIYEVVDVGFAIGLAQLLQDNVVLGDQVYIRFGGLFVGQWSACG